MVFMIVFLAIAGGQEMPQTIRTIYD